ncbi:MAG: gamma-glutamyltransferase, partial [SAR324 cluster bacterium]|nr:gamma-glutamyltransferase [SAR324 cluster bacterium]
QRPVTTTRGDIVNHWHNDRRVTQPNLPPVGSAGLVLLSLIALSACGSTTEPAAARRPNILFAISDDQSFPHAGVYGDPNVSTPAFDRVAREGVLFTHSYTAAPSCTPSRSAILSGQAIWRLGEAGVLMGTYPPDLVSFPRMLEEAGYRIGYTGKAWGPGTVHVDVIDSAGNMVACTPSGAWIRSAEVMPGLGFPLGNRMQTFYLEPAHHPNLVAPCKRPRTTISPSMVFKGDQPWLVFGSMGGDQQDQWQLQFLLNMLEFGMTLQEAIEAPKFSSEHFPEFFYPHGFDLNRLRIEPRVDEQVLRELARRGHDLEIAGDWSEGYLLAAARDAATGLLEAGCDLRAEKSEVFPSFALCW